MLNFGSLWAKSDLDSKTLLLLSKRYKKFVSLNPAHTKSIITTKSQNSMCSSRDIWHDWFMFNHLKRAPTIGETNPYLNAFFSSSVLIILYMITKSEIFGCFLGGNFVNVWNQPYAVPFASYVFSWDQWTACMFTFSTML